MWAQRIAVGLAVACGLGQSGCSTVAPGPERLLNTGTSYSAGRAIQDFSLPMSKVGEAVTEAMTDLNMTAIETGRDGVVYKIQAKTVDKRNVMVTLRPTGCRRVSAAGSAPSAMSRSQKLCWSERASGSEPFPRRQSPSMFRAHRLNPFFSRDAVPDEEMLKDVAEAPYRDRVIP